MLGSIFVLFSCFMVVCLAQDQFQNWCAPNEEVRCVTSCPPEKTCENRGIQYACAAVYKPCKHKCVCKNGYYRNNLGDCILEKQCEVRGRSYSSWSNCDHEALKRRERVFNRRPGFLLPNEEIRCVQSCPPEKTCENRRTQFSCAQIYEPCRFKRVCKAGYFRNYLGSCITEAQCAQCSGKNEFFACDSACDNECRTLSSQNRTNCPIQNIVCNPMCYCKDGFARDRWGNCIPVDKCSPSRICGQNEVFRIWKKTCPDLCFSLVARFKCAPNTIYKPGCACKPGYLRKCDKSACVPICECPEMKNSPLCRKRIF